VNSHALVASDTHSLRRLPDVLCSVDRCRRESGRRTTGVLA
jgi:hypothetical protein